MLEGEAGQVVMDTAKSIGEVKPAHTQGSVFSSCLVEHGEQLDVVFSAARHPINKSLLHGSVEIVVGSHVGHPTLLQQAGEYLANAGGQGNGAEVLGIAGVFLSFFFPRRRRTPIFHAAGTLFTDQHELKMWSSAGISDGHFLKTRYSIWSMGLGHEEIFRLEMTSDISSSVKALTSKPVERVAQTSTVVE